MPDPPAPPETSDDPAGDLLKFGREHGWFDYNRTKDALTRLRARITDLEQQVENLTHQRAPE